MKKIGILFLSLGLMVLMSAFAAADTVLIDFESLITGSPVEGMGTVHPNLDISCPGIGTVIEEGKQPYAYDANQVNNNDFKNGCLDGIKGFANTAAAPPYERGDFTFEFDGTVSSFSVEMYDYGDYNPLRNRYMVMAITAYDQSGVVVDSDSINWDVSSQMYPYPNKDACAKGNPNHYTWAVSGAGIAKVVLDMVSGPDPGVGFDNLQFELEETVCESETTDLIAGGGNPKSAIDVGEVTVSSDGETLEATYTVDVEGWEITETHLDVECELEDIPQTQPNKKGKGGGNPIPGQFDYINYFDPGVTEYTVSINLDDICCTDPVIAAHAVVQKETLLNPSPYYADFVVDYSQGLRKDGTPVNPGRSIPEQGLVFEPGQQESSFFSLGFGGWLTAGFNCPIRNGPGDDIKIIEDTWGGNYPLEEAEVYASNDGFSWFYLGVADNTNLSNIHTISTFDLGSMAEARYIKIVDITDPAPHNNQGDGYDLNAIEALQDCVAIQEETAWGEGPDFPGKNWAMYFGYDLSECYEPDCPVDGIGGITGMVAWIGNLLGGGQ